MKQLRSARNKPPPRREDKPATTDEAHAIDRDALDSRRYIRLPESRANTWHQISRRLVALLCIYKQVHVLDGVRIHCWERRVVTADPETHEIDHEMDCLELKPTRTMCGSSVELYTKRAYTTKV